MPADGAVGKATLVLTNPTTTKLTQCANIECHWFGTLPE